MYVVSVLYQCCICCNGCTRMLQRSVTNVSSVFSDECCKCVLFGCCICFTHILHVFYLDVAYICKGFQVFSTFKCIISDENLDIVIIFNIF